MKKSLTAAVLGLTLVATLSACGGDDDNISKSDRDKASQAALAATGGGAVTDAGKGDGDDNYAYEVEVTFKNGTDVDVELDENFKVTNSPPKASDFESGAGTTPAPSTTEPNTTATTPDGDADDKALTGTTLKKASDAALKATGGGKITETGGSDDRDHVYEVDVLLENGEDVTVELDGSYKVTKINR